MSTRAGASVVLRSLTFLTFVLLTLAVFAPLAVLLVLPRRVCLAIATRVVRFWLWLLKHVVGLRYEVRGREHLAAAGPCLIASKHQSAFETIALQIILDDPAIVLKRELTWIPVAGWTMARLHHIAIDRKAGASALMALVRDAKARLADGRSVVIFPEGTRTAPLAAPAYKPGIVALYRALRTPCIPVALNSGVFWPRRSLWRFPGTIIIEFLPPIPAGLRADAFREALEGAIETRSTELARAALARA
ncbi:lysophospholipid acyltransferase family protein [Stappia sp.]|jgi:1-acyl-sn-glycerol-3-phosphate acyltransferase|uniref:lysophospholipid acyltransferase family protein n=1 Tax=Stappia sp. TaxID=1870903 RepID=UPI003A9965EB